MKTDRTTKLLLSLIAAALWGLLLRTPTTPAVQADEAGTTVKAPFTVTDEQGKPILVVWKSGEQATLDMFQHGRVRLLGENGQALAGMAAQDQGGYISATNSHDKGDVVLTTFKGRGGFVAIHGVDGQPTCNLETGTDRSGGLGLYDGDGVRRILLAAGKNSTAFIMTSKKGDPRAGLAVVDEGGSFTLWDHDDKVAFSRP